MTEKQGKKSISGTVFQKEKIKYKVQLQLSGVYIETTAVILVIFSSEISCKNAY